jgi:hypothetical protein
MLVEKGIAIATGYQNEGQTGRIPLAFLSVLAPVFSLFNLPPHYHSPAASVLSGDTQNKEWQIESSLEECNSDVL